MPPRRGFTLLELLLVLALVALLTAAVAPRLLGWVDTARSRATVDNVRSLLLAQRSLAFHAQQPRRLQDDSPAWALPAGWRLELSQPLQWQANGMARGGRLRLWQGRELRADWVVEALSGTLRPATAGDGPFKPADAGKEPSASASASASEPAFVFASPGKRGAVPHAPTLPGPTS